MRKRSYQQVYMCQGLSGAVHLHRPNTLDGRKNKRDIVLGISNIQKKHWMMHRPCA